MRSNLLKNHPEQKEVNQRDMTSFPCRIFAAILFILMAGAAAIGAEDAAPTKSDSAGSTESLPDALPPMPKPEDLVERPLKGLARNEAVTRALEDNKQLAVQRVTPAIQEARIMAAKGPFDAIASANINYSRVDTQTALDPALLPPGSPFKAVTRSLNGGAGITKRWFTGTQTTLDFSAMRSRTSPSPREYQSAATLSIRQNLLKGLSPAANLALIHEAENSFKRSQYVLRGEVIATVADVETAYWNLALAYELLAVQQYSLTLAERQLERTRVFVEVGSLPPLEVTSAEAEVAARRRDLIDAKNSLENHVVDFLLLTEGMLPDDGNYTLPRPTDEAQMPELLGTDKESIEIAMRTRPDLFQAELDRENGRLEVIRTKDGMLPRLDAIGSYGVTGRGLQFHDSRDRASDADFDQYSIGAEFEFPILNRAARGNFRAAKATEEQFEKAIENLKENIKADVLKGRIDLKNKIAAVDAARSAVALQEQRLINEEEKWRNGLSTNLDVFQTQRDLVNSRNQLFVRIAGAFKSEINLYVQEGSILEVRGIKTEGGEVLK
ncbi:TolC family protein [Candidatus Sumerlaeota bacterium]|nr:TolC family protein [Candidatus Sumerlaeota bacterium]